MRIRSPMTVGPRTVERTSRAPASTNHPSLDDAPVVDGSDSGRLDALEREPVASSSGLSLPVSIHYSDRRCVRAQPVVEQPPDGVGDLQVAMADGAMAATASWTWASMR